MDKIKQLQIALLKEKLEKLTETKVSLQEVEIAPENKWVVAMVVVNQYAPGVTGQNLMIYIEAGPDKTGYNSKKEAQIAFKTKQPLDRNKFKTRRDSEGLGWYYHKPQVMTISELANQKNTGSHYFKYGSPVYLK